MTHADVSPDVTTHGPGDPEVAVVGGIHGDEPSGVRAVERLREADLDCQRGVKLVVANPPAVAAGERGLDADMNRSFPGNPDADAREERLAAALREETRGLATLSMHSTHSHPKPIAFVSRHNPDAQRIAASLPVAYVVDESRAAEGAFTESGGVVSVEAGRQGESATVDAAESLARAFLEATDALAEDPPMANPEFYALDTEVRKPAGEEYELCAENFERIEAGEVVARVGDTELRADDPFVPVLMSENGYREVFGYRGHYVGRTLAAAQRQWDVPASERRSVDVEG